MRGSRAGSAFTLIEILLAVMVFAIVLAAMSSVLFSAFRLRNAASRAVEESLPIQQAVAAMKRDLINVVPPGGTMSGSFQTVLSGAVTLPGQFGPTFYTSTAQLDETLPWGDVEKVFYALTESTNRMATGKDLIRASTQNLLPVLAEDLPAQRWLMGGVQTVVFSYYDGSQWRDTWDTTTPDPTTGYTNMLPVAIRVQIQMAASEERKQAPLTPVEFVVPITAQARTNMTGQTSTTGQ